ncbi:MAG: leucine-rich repeat protein [Alistipes sp.]|nr:leucine-rich repeat protein [Alistipes sp.]
MRKIYSALLCASLVLVGCTQDFDTPVYDPQTPTTPTGDLRIDIENNINQIGTTRATDSGFCDGDAVGIYAVNYKDGAPGTLQLEGNQADNVRYMFDAEEYKWIPEYDVYFLDDDTAVDLIGYYPYADPSSVTEYPFEVQRKQNTEAGNGLMGGYEASDFLWSKATNVAPTEKRIKMTFYHRMAGVYVTLVEGSGWADGEWAQLQKEVLVKNTIRKSTIDLATGTVTPTGEKPADDIIPFVDGYNFRAVVVPQSIGSGESLFSITVDGVPYNYKYKVDGVPTTFDYVSGKMHKFTIEVSKKEQTGIEFKELAVSITAWEADNVSHQDDAREYVVVHCPFPGDLERTMVDRLEMDVTKIKNLKLTGAIDHNDYYFMRDNMTSLMRLNLKEVESKIDGVYKIPDSAFGGKTTLIKCVLPDKLERIEGSAFNNTSLTGTLLLPEGVKYVTGFEGTKISNVQFPSTLEAIGGSAFSSCSALMCELSLPHSLKIIDNSAFRYSAIRGNLVLPEGLEHIGSFAFDNCSGLTGSLTIPNGIKVIEIQSFGWCGFNGTLTLPKGLSEIQTNAFCCAKFKGELNIPESVTIIGEGAFAATEFNGTLILPKELIVLGSGAFTQCWRLSGVVEIPENITVIPSLLFERCSSLEGVVLHKDVEVIESGAFANCFYITSLVSKAKNPPVVDASCFNGVAKDNFVVEVPEESVKKYQFASGWDEFKRIEAHREFSISRNLLRTLNAEHSKTFLVRALAGEEWSVESCPDWVTVTPSSGVGKTEVTVTVNEMTATDVDSFTVETLINSWGGVETTTHDGRKGEIVFLLNEKEYRSRMTVEQYDYEYSDGDMITHQTATVGNGVNIVLMGDCFDARDIAMGKYLDAMNEAYPYFFDIEPYLTYKDYFNVYSVFGMSADSGMGTVNTIREARFGSQYTLNAGVEPDFETVFAGACVAPINDDVSTTLIILIENSSEYSGLCYMYGDGSAVAVVPMSNDPAPYDFRGLVHHEAGGHGFGKLADEYIYHNSFVSACPVCGNGPYLAILANKSYGFYENVSLTGDWNEIEWSHLIFDPQYSNVVDVYEGAYMHARGVYRSEATSCMNNNIPYYNAISREAMVKRIMKYAGEEYSFEAFKAKDYESLPSSARPETRAWDGESNTSGSSQFNQRPPKFMGEKPKFDKSKF